MKQEKSNVTLISDNFKKEIKITDWTNLQKSFDEKDRTSIYNNLCSKFNEIYEKASKIKQVNELDKTKPWINDYIKIKLNKKNQP